MRRDSIDQFVEREMEDILYDMGVSCSGWESDPQSLSKRVAETFCLDAFNSRVGPPHSITCAPTITPTVCVVRYGGAFPFNITVDLTQVPGLVTATGTAAPFAMRQKRCSYRYSCDSSGSISFTRVNCVVL
jgi:hypothetical protein